MTEWILSSSILILAVIAVRTLFKGKISLRLQYGLWGLVLLRLLLPVNFGDSALSVGNLKPVVVSRPAVQEVIELGQTTVTQPTYEEAYHQVAQRYESQGVSVSQLQLEERESFEAEVTEQMQGKSLAEVAADVAVSLHLAGGIAVAGVFLASNLRFRSRLKKSRVRLYDVDSPLPVYLSDAVDTPCLFGVVKSAIYVTEQAVEDDAVLRHTLAHEATHYCHGDHIWAVARCVCLALHWYNPLVWAAAFLSQRDGELACDEAAIKRLGEEERAAYGRTLIGMTCRKRANFMVASTTMTASKRGLKERIVLIAKKPKMAVYTLVAVVVIAAICVGCTFTGARDSGAAPDEPVNVTYGAPIFKEGEVTGMTVRFAGGEEVKIEADKLEEYVTWAKTFTFGKAVTADSLLGACSVTLAYSDGTEQSSDINRVAVEETVYQVDRAAAPASWQELREEPQVPLTQTQEPEIDFDKGVLYDKAVPGQLNLAVIPTQVGTYCYFVPYYGLKDEMEEALEQAEERQTDAIFSGMAISWGDEWWNINTDGTLSNANRVIAAEHAARVIELCQLSVEAIHMGEVVMPERLTTLENAWLAVGEQVYTLTDQNALDTLADWLSVSEACDVTSCGYGALLTMELEDGSFATINLAMDGCGTWLSEGRFFEYGSDSEALFGLFEEKAEVSEGRRIVAAAPLNEDCALPELKLDSDTVVAPQPSALALSNDTWENFAAMAKAGADALFDNYTVEEGEGAIKYHAELEDTPYGAFRRYIGVDLDDGELTYSAMWVDTEETPYFYDPGVSEEEAIALARELAAAFGLEELAAVAPEVEKTGSVSYKISWNSEWEELYLPGRYLIVRVIGDDAVNLRLRGGTVVPATDGNIPDYFLTLEEALYCINYARGLAQEDDSEFYSCQILKEVRLVWTTEFVYGVYPSVSYTPAYAFVFTNRYENMTTSFMVDAYTGLVGTGTNEGRYPSPFIFVGN